MKAVDGNFGNWFYSRLDRVLGNGMNCRFWEDVWEGELPLRSRFPRLFHLCCDKREFVGEMGEWVDDRWEWRFRWRRGLRGRDQEEEKNLQEWLKGVKLKRNNIDGWSWGGATERGFSVKRVYEAIAAADVADTSGDEEKKTFCSLWKASAPLKAKVVGWRAIHNKLPTRDNLLRRCPIPAEGRRCTSCDEALETADHFFLRCELTDRLWGSIVRWVGADWVPPGNLSSHFLCFGSLLRGKRKSKLLAGLWLCVVSVLCSWRNGCVFENRLWDLRKVEDEIKSRYWGWYVAFLGASSSLSYREWSSRSLCETLGSL